MSELKALCMSCREEKNKNGKMVKVPTMQTMKEPKVTEKNGRYSAKGQCEKCDGNMFKFMSKVDGEKMM